MSKFSLSGTIDHFKTYWSKPPKGRFLSYKEAAAYCVGGMGIVGASVMPSFVTLGIGSYIAVALGIQNTHIVLVGIITSIITILRAPLISMIIDNTHTKMGKFRPYLIWLTIPIIIISFIFGWLPNIFDPKTQYVPMLVTFTIVFNILSFLMAVHTLAFTSLLQVITPNQSEKEGLMAIGSVVYSLGPSIVNALFPLLANYLYGIKADTGKMTTAGINVIGTYKWIFPVMLSVCILFGLITALGTKERTVVSKEFKQRVSFLSGVKKTAQNQYFWMSTISNAVGALKTIVMSYTVWICTYMIQREWAQSLFVTIMGSACLPGMLLAPLLIKKLGKRKITIISNMVTAISAVPMMLCCAFPSPAGPYILLLLTFVATMLNAVQVVTGPMMNTQMYDYQQYKTGDRLEGFLSQFSAIIITAVGMGTAFIQPAIYEQFGYTGAEETTKVLYTDAIYKMIMWNLLVGMGAGLLGTIPYLFWNMTEKRHNEIIEILKVRALRDDGKIPEENAYQIENSIESGNGSALNEYLIENPLTDDEEEFISVADNDGDIYPPVEEDTTFTDLMDESKDDDLKF